MKLLAFETATEACSVALWIDGEVTERFEIAPRRHAELSLPWAEGLLAGAGIAKAQLDAIAVGRGPGAFTGVRLAISIAQGIALALDRPVVAVSTLAALAMQTRGERILAAIDARMGEVYSAAFARNGVGFDNAVLESDDVSALSQEIVSAPAAVTLPGDGSDWYGVGSGFAAAEGLLQRTLQMRLREVDASALPHAADVARLAVLAYARGEAVAPERLEPAYLRNDVALTLAQQNARRARVR